MKFNSDICDKPVVVDTKAIATGLYAMFSADERACVAFGMLPESKFSIVRDHLGKVAERLWPDAEHIFSAHELDSFSKSGFDLRTSNKERVDELRKKFVADVEYAISLNMYKIAPMVV